MWTFATQVVSIHLCVSPILKGKRRPGVSIYPSINQSINQSIKTILSEEFFAENAADTLERVFLVHRRLAFHLCLDVGPDLLQRGSVLGTSEVHLESLISWAGIKKNTFLRRKISYQAWVDRPAVQLRAVLFDHQNGRLGHAMLVLGLVGNSHADEVARLEFLEEDVVRVDNGGSGVACGGAHGFQIFGAFLGGYDDGGAAGGGDAARETLESLDVGDAEGAPVAAVVC